MIGTDSSPRGGTTTKRNYEVLYIVDATLTDEQIEPIIEKYSKLIVDQGGEVQAAGKWDKRRLAYEVAGHRDGTYILMYFVGESATADELDRVLRISGDSFRHLITRVEPEHVDTSRIEQPQPMAEAEAAPEEAAPAEAAEVPAAEEAVAPAEEATAEPVAEEPAEEPAPQEEAPAETPAEEGTTEEAGEEEQAAE